MKNIIDYIPIITKYIILYYVYMSMVYLYIRRHIVLLDILYINIIGSEYWIIINIRISECYMIAYFAIHSLE